MKILHPKCPSILGTFAAAVAIATGVGGVSVATAAPHLSLNPLKQSTADRRDVHLAGLKLCFPVQICFKNKAARRRPGVRDKRGRRVRDKRNRAAEAGRCRVFDARTGRCRVMDKR